MKCFYIRFSDYGLKTWNPVSQLVEYLLVDLYWKLLVHRFVKYRVNSHLQDDFRVLYAQIFW